MATPATPQPKRPIQKPEQREGLMGDIVSSLKLKWALLHDKRVSGWLKLGFWIAIPWILFPDLIAGPVDDMVALLFLAKFEELCPPWVVEEVRKRLSKPPVPPTPQSAPTTPPPPPQPHQRTAPAAPIEVDRSHTVTVHQNPTGEWTYFRFTGAFIELIGKNRGLKHALGKLGELNGDSLIVAKTNEVEVIAELSKRVNGLRIIYPKKKS